MNMKVNLFTFEKIKYGSKIMIYGAGRGEQSYIRQIELTNCCEIIAIAEI